MGIEDVLDVFIPDNKKYQRIPETSNEPSVTGAWSFQGGYYGARKRRRLRSTAISILLPTSRIRSATSWPAISTPGLRIFEIGFPKELSGADGIGPKLEAIVKGLKIETWDSGGSFDLAVDR